MYLLKEVSMSIKKDNVNFFLMKGLKKYSVRKSAHSRMMEDLSDAFVLHKKKGHNQNKKKKAIVLHDYRHII